MKDRKERIWRCECGGPHFLSIISDPDNEAWISLETPSIERGAWRQKLKAAWAILRHGHYDAWINVFLTKEVAADVARELLTVAGYTGFSYSVPVSGGSGNSWTFTKNTA